MLPLVYINSVFETLAALTNKKYEDLSPQEANFIQVFEMHMRKYLIKKSNFSFTDPDPLKKHSPFTRKRYAVTQALREQRLKRGLTLLELSKITGLTASYLSRLEHGKRRLNADTIKVISTALRCKLEDILM